MCTSCRQGAANLGLPATLLQLCPSPSAGAARPASMAGSGMLPRPCRRLGRGRNGCGRVGGQGALLRASKRRAWIPEPGAAGRPRLAAVVVASPGRFAIGWLHRLLTHGVPRGNPASHGPARRCGARATTERALAASAAHLALRRGARLLARPVGRAGMQPALRQRPQRCGHDHRGYHAAYRCLHSLCTVSGVEAAQRRRPGPPAMSITAACRTGQAGQEAIPLATGV